MILHILDEIAKTSSTIEKEDIIRKYKDVPFFRDVLEMAYNTNYVYYMKSVPIIAEMGMIEHTLADGLSCLGLIATRKLRGAEASTTLGKMLASMPLGDATVIQRVLARDLRCSIGDKIINKVFPALIPTTPYMGAKPFTKQAVLKLFKSGQYIESDVKMDGRYVNLIIDKYNNVTMVSRQGKPSFFDNPNLINDAQAIAKSLRRMINCENSDGIVLNGELTMDGISRYTANGIIASVVDITEKMGDGVDVTKLLAKFQKETGMEFAEAVSKIIITVWDWLPLSVYNVGNKDKAFSQHRRTRLADLERAIETQKTTHVRMIEYRYVKTYEEAMEHFAEVIATGGEGTILKAPDGVWVDGKPVYQIKCKLEIECDLEIIGFNEGTGKYVGQLGSLTCQTKDGLLKAAPFAFSEDLRVSMWNDQANLLGKIVKIKANGMSHDVNGNWSLLHPIFKEVRTDKIVADSLADVKKIQNMALGLEQEIS